MYPQKWPRCRAGAEHKEGQARRTETTINNTRDFYIGESLRNLPALRKIGLQANRVLEVQTITHDSILAEETLQQLQRPRIVEGQRVAALRFADSTVQALWNAVLMYDLLPAISPVPNPLLRCFDKLQQEISAWVDEAGMMA